MLQRGFDTDLQQYYFVNTEDHSISYDLPCEVQYTPDMKREKSNSSLHFPSLKRNKSTSSSCLGSETHSQVANSSHTSVISKITSVLSRGCSQKSKSQKSSSSIISRTFSNASLNSQKASTLRLLTEKTARPVKEQQIFQKDVFSFNVLSIDDDSYSMISGLDDEMLLENAVNYGYQRNYYNANNKSSTYNSEDDYSDEESIHSYYSELARDAYYYEYEEESIYDLEKEKERLELRIQMRQELEA